MSILSARGKLLPHLTAVIIFIIVTLLYFSPVLDNKALLTNDTTVFKGISREIVEFREEYDEEPLWTNSLFSGMPAYLISTQFTGNLVKPLYNLLRSPGIPVAPMILLMVGFYILLLSFRVNPWLAIAGAIAYGFSTYLFTLFAAGHNTKIMALSYAAPLIASIVYSYRRNRLMGSALTALFLSIEIIANHLQITYYLFLTLLIFGIVELADSIKKHTLPDFLKTTFALLVAAILALAVNFASLYTTWEYSKYSIRGKSELTSQLDDKTTGLDKSYATDYSYGIDETLTLLIPNMKGGASIPFSRDSEVVKVLRQNNFGQYATQFRQYWGNQPQTSGPRYVGAIVFLLFIMGTVLIKGPDKWWLLSATILAILLAWGKNFMFLTNLFLDYFPGYNKFRAVTTILVIAEFCFPLLAILTLDKIFKNEVNKQDLIKALKIGVGATGGILLLFILFPGIAGPFLSPAETDLPDWLKNALISDRKDMLMADALKSFALVLAAGLIIYVAYFKKFQIRYAIGLIAFLVLIDMWTVGKRYLNNDNFIRKPDLLNNLSATLADNYIHQDTSQYRVLNLSVYNPFADGTTSYQHQSIGGYHGAKIRRYQDLIENSISRDVTMLSNSLNSVTSIDQLEDVFKPLNSLNMLNTRYIIINPANQPLVNPDALGNAWFVHSYILAENADQELSKVNNINPAVETVVDQRFADLITESTYKVDSLDNIKLVSYKPNELIYYYSATDSQFAVFSEIYYPEGWNAYLDGQPVDHFRANYVLRAMILPEGSHTVTFRFEPDSYKLGNKVSLAGSVSLILLFLGSMYISLRRKKDN
ncbi:MAG TPA: YfhO family protein [Bacteroidales bacterium]|nr:YfhO family protein [Bacteroidales bacterium]